MGAAGPAETGGSGFPDLCQSVTALGQHFDVCAACTILSGASGKADGSHRLTGAGHFRVPCPGLLLKFFFLVPEAILMSREAKLG